MKKCKHTPGPWVITRISGVITGVGRIEKANGGTLTEMVANAILPDTDAEYKKVEPQITADFNLISAAPDMYDAIQYFLSVQREVNGAEWLENTTDHVLTKMKDAIKKAEAK